MAKIVQISDFVGKYAIATNSHTTIKLQYFIDKYETKYLYDLLGITLGNLLLADITTPFAQPITLKYQTIYNALNLEADTLIRSNGIKEMLVGFIYWEYVRTANIVNTITGNVQAENEVSKVASYSETNIYSNYNDSIDTYMALQYYAQSNTVDYATFKGVNKQYVSWVI